jgi:hypothetical protein
LYRKDGRITIDDRGVECIDRQFGNNARRRRKCDQTNDANFGIDRHHRPKHDDRFGIERIYYNFEEQRQRNIDGVWIRNTIDRKWNLVRRIW